MIQFDYVLIKISMRKCQIIFCLGFSDMNHFPDSVIHNNEKLSLAVALIVDPLIVHSYMIEDISSV